MSPSSLDGMPPARECCTRAGAARAGGYPPTSRRSGRRGDGGGVPSAGSDASPSAEGDGLTSRMQYGPSLPPTRPHASDAARGCFGLAPVAEACDAGKQRRDARTRRSRSRPGRGRRFTSACGPGRIGLTPVGGPLPNHCREHSGGAVQFDPSTAAAVISLVFVVLSGATALFSRGYRRYPGARAWVVGNLLMAAGVAIGLGGRADWSGALLVVGNTVSVVGGALLAVGSARFAGRAWR